MSAQRAVHASAVAVGGRGVLVTGDAGSGKSALCLQLMALGGVLIADDRVVLRRESAQVIADAPEATAGLIEARGVGILRCSHAPAPLALVVRLTTRPDDRLPPLRNTMLLDVQLPLVLGPLTAHLPFAIRLLLDGGRLDPDASLPPGPP
ncbi:MAG: serine kinase [Paracoccus sp. (in: a-proteobacteria)]|nr:serine kinase [Paracoccus sp. (in: a-proteobacteria)]